MEYFGKRIFLVFCLLVIWSCTDPNEKRVTLEQSPQGNKNTSVETSISEPKTLFRGEPVQNVSRNWWDSTSIYYIWVRSFYDSNDDGHGDLRGIESKLDYLETLGIETLLLSPIFESPSYHGYDVVDFNLIETDFGSWQDLKSLISASKAKGFKIMLDVPINHVSDQHPWFLNAVNQVAPYENYFIWAPIQRAGYGKPWSKEPEPQSVWHYKINDKNRFYYAAFDYSQPDLNYNSAFIQNFFMNLFKKLAELGIDGVRLDAVRYLFEDGPLPLQADSENTREYLAKLRGNIKKEYPDFYFLGEALSDLPTAKGYLHTHKAVDQLYDFGTNFLIQDIVKGSSYEKIADANLSNEMMTKALKTSFYERLQRRFSNGFAPSDFVTFLNSHDFERLSATESIDIQRQKLSASILGLMPGPISLYYGEEIWLPQLERGDDAYLRAPMHWDDELNLGFSNSLTTWIDNGEFFPWWNDFTPWWSKLVNDGEESFTNVNAQIRNKESLLNHYIRLLNIRKKYKAFFSPSKIEYVESEDGLFTTRYYLGSERLQITINMGQGELPLSTIDSKQNIILSKGDFYVELQ